MAQILNGLGNIHAFDLGREYFGVAILDKLRIHTCNSYDEGMSITANWMRDVYNLH